MNVLYNSFEYYYISIHFSNSFNAQIQISSLYYLLFLLCLSLSLSLSLSQNSHLMIITYLPVLLTIIRIKNMKKIEEITL